MNQYFDNTLIYLSGADRKVARRLPVNDKKPYRWIGVLNLLILLIFIFCYMEMIRILHPSILLIGTVSPFAAVLVLAGLLTASRQSIKKISYESSLFFIFNALVVTTFIGLTFSLNNANAKRVANIPDIERTRTSLLADTIEIKDQKADLNFQLDSDFSKKKTNDTGSQIALDNYIQRYFRPHFDFLTLASSKVRELPLTDTTDLQNRIARLSKTLYQPSEAVADNDIRDWQQLYLFLLHTDHITAPDFRDIISFVDATAFDRLPLDAKITFLLSSGTTQSEIAVFCFCFLIMLIFFSLIYSTIKSGQNDFYHSILTEMQKQETQGLMAERQRVADEFRIKAEIRNTNVARNEFQLNDPGQPNPSSPPLAPDGELTPERLFDTASLVFQRGDNPKALEYINKAIELDDQRSANSSQHHPHPEFYELKSKVLAATSDSAGAKVALDRFVELDEENKYKANLTREILLDRIEVSNLPFLGSFSWKFTPGINILLGKNGYGKSHLLRLLVALLYCDKTKVRDWIPPNALIEARAKAYLLSDHPIREQVIAELRTKMDLAFIEREKKDNSEEKRKEIDRQIDDLVEQLDGEQRRILANKYDIISNIGRVPILAIPDSRFIDRSEQAIANIKITSEDLRKDGATEFLNGRPFGPIINKGLFIIAQTNRTDFGKEPYNLIQRVISELADPGPLRSPDPANQLGSDNSGKSDKPAGPQTPFFRFSHIETSSTTGDLTFYVESEEIKEPIQLQSISQGTFSILSICLLIYRFLKELKPKSNDPIKEKAIVLIDEIDAHLHPSWEQKIIGILRREFPHVQFIITAHSPLIVAGCLEGEVSVIRHSEKGFILEQSGGNFIGCSTPDLFKRVFEIEDKDAQYLHYAAISPQKEDLELRIKKFENQKKDKTISESQLQEMSELQKILNYIQAVKNVQNKEADVGVLETQNMLLKTELEKLKSQPAEKKQP